MKEFVSTKRETWAIEFNSIWKDQSEGFPDSQRLDFKALMDETENTCKQDSEELLGLWLAILDEGMQFLHHLHEYSFNCFLNSDKEHSPVFIMLVARILSHSLAIRRLVTTGLDDAARSVARSLLETQELAIVCLVDDTFAQTYFDRTGDGPDSKIFWKENVAYGKIINRIKDILADMDYDIAAEDGFFANRSKIKKVLSDSVHPTSDIVFASNFIPSLKHHGKFSRSITGHLHVQSPDLLTAVIDQIFYLGSIALNQLITDTPPLVLIHPSKEAVSSMLISFLTFQEVLDRYEDLLQFSPEYSIKNEEE